MKKMLVAIHYRIHQNATRTFSTHSAYPLSTLEGYSTRKDSNVYPTSLPSIETTLNPSIPSVLSQHLSQPIAAVQQPMGFLQIPSLVTQESPKPASNGVQKSQPKLIEKKPERVYSKRRIIYLIIAGTGILLVFLVIIARFVFW
ncbi:hypothetical protein PENTCL1PPCAC_30451 [Pristionchus entomophagus]|uniref:Uncharacterized protein n=1 Tax=Pristionchus entomophagus TaxID=358040 RepID=A0AAV5UPS2_9BILA|nr:hypothetical protein PENTCL1PPCAC_30451 [Pristionchus entomophagus]